MVSVTSFQPEDFFEMTSVIRIVLVALMLVSASLQANGDVILSAAQVNPGPIVEGSSSTFDIFARSTTGNQAFITFGFNLSLSTPTGTVIADERGGRFTNPATNLLGGIGWRFNQSNPALAIFDANSSGSITSFGDANVRIGSITLATPGATPGNYSMGFSLVNGLSPTLGQIVGSGQSLSYSITAVPEPSSMALLCVAGVAAWGYRRRARKN